MLFQQCGSQGDPRAPASCHPTSTCDIGSRQTILNFPQVFFRAGLNVFKADSVYANEICDCKKPSTSTHPCITCMVHRDDLGKWNIIASPRTSKYIENGLDLLRSEDNRSTREREATRLGLVLRGSMANPYREFASMDTVRQIPPDIFHQDALVS